MSHQEHVCRAGTGACELIFPYRVINWNIIYECRSTKAQLLWFQNDLMNRSLKSARCMFISDVLLLQTYSFSWINPVEHLSQGWKHEASSYSTSASHAQMNVLFTDHTHSLSEQSPCDVVIFRCLQFLWCFFFFLAASWWIISRSWWDWWGLVTDCRMTEWCRICTVHGGRIGEISKRIMIII